MKPPLDQSRIAKALEDAGLEPGEARAAAVRLRAGTRPGQPGYPLDTTSRRLRDELLQAIAGTERHIEDTQEQVIERVEAANRRHVDTIRHHLDAVEHRIAQHLARHERRRNRIAWMLFAALAAALVIALAALGYLD